jgi:DNA-binding MarR family transcriptional regulator
MTPRHKKLSDADFVRLANFRYALRCFLEFSESAAAREGVTPQQHQALLVIRASDGATATVGHLAGRLRIRHNTAVELAQRLEHSGLITRRISGEDRRTVLLSLTPDGSTRLEKLTQVHRAELQQLSPELMQMIRSLDAGAA